MSKVKRELKFEDYFKSMQLNNHICYVDQVGLQDTNLNITLSTDLDLSIKEVFIFTSEGILLVNNKFNPISSIKQGKVSNLLTELVISIQKTLNPNNHFKFNKIYIHNLKIMFLFKSHLVIVGIFTEHTSSLLIKLYLTQMFIAFTNFNYYYIEILRPKYNVERINEILKIRDMRSNYVRVIDNVDFANFEFFQIKIFEHYFIKSLTFHFERVSKHILRKEEMYLSSIKFKNMYVVDLYTNEIIFDMMTMRKSVKNTKYYKNEKLWQEIMFHSNNLMNSYNNSIGLLADATESTYKCFFVKFECTSTFPRLTFIIKFLPILKGVSIIHIYSTKKLSRNSDNNEGNISNKYYKEIDILYGTEIKNNPNIEFLYIEPKKLQEIERFFFEFYVSISSNMDIFYNLNHEIKYFDFTILNKIKDILISNKNSTRENIFIKINNFYYENYIKNKFQYNNQLENQKTINNPNYFMILTKEMFISEFYHFQENMSARNQDKSFNDVTINLSKVEEVKYNDNDASFDIANKASFLSKDEDFQLPSFIIPVKAKFSNNVNNFSHTLDYFVHEIGEKRTNRVEENGATEARESEHSSFIKNIKNFKDRSSSLNHKCINKNYLSPMETPMKKLNKDYFAASGSPKFNNEDIMNVNFKI